MVARTLTTALVALLLAAPSVWAQNRAGVVVVPPQANMQRLPPPFVNRSPGPRATPPFRDPTAAEAAALRRAYRQSLDGTAVAPNIGTTRVDPNAAARAFGGRSTLDAARAGAFARSGPAAIGSSPVTRPSLGPRR